MDMEPKTDVEKVCVFTKVSSCLRGLHSKSLAKVHDISTQTKKTAKDDSRRLTHSFKVGLALTLVQFFCYFHPLFNTLGNSAMWAMITVVVVFEFSVGAMLGKGLNRGLATLVAGALGLGAHRLASLTGKTSDPIIIGLFVFLLAVVTTFIRFFPRVKARYDYGLLIFILTFCLVSQSGFQTEEIIKMIQVRLLTILIGASTCVLVSILVCPVWAGEDLHKLVAQNLDKIGSFLEGIMDEPPSENGRAPSLLSLDSVLVDSKIIEQNLANFATWEPGHGRFMYRHPWKQYLKIGNLTRQCACRVEALSGHLTSEIIQALNPGIMRETLSELSSESGKALKEVAWTIETMTTTRPSSSANPNINNLKTASKNLMRLLLETWFVKEHISVDLLLHVIPVAALFIDTVAIVEDIDNAVKELSSAANFKLKETTASITIGDHTNTSMGGIRIDT